MHNLCVFCTFSTFAQKIFKGWGCNFTWSFGKVMHNKLMKMVFVARIVRLKLCMIYAFFFQKLVSDCCDKFDYPGCIDYLSFWCKIHSMIESIFSENTKKFRMVTALVSNLQNILTCTIYENLRFDEKSYYLGDLYLDLNYA